MMKVHHMKKLLIPFAVVWSLVAPVCAQTIDNLGAGSAVSGTDIFPAYQGSNPAKGVTANQLKTFIAPGGGPSGSSSMQVFNVTGAAGNGTTDDQGPINTALTACGNAGGGWVVLSNGRYLVDTVGLTVPSRCIVYCPVPLLGNANPTNYSSVPYGVILNSAQTITMSKNAGWQGCPVLQKAVVNSTAWADYPTLTYRDLSNIVAAFAGTAFTFNGANDVQIRDTFVGGFAVGLSGAVSGTARFQADHVNIDATKCLLLDNSHDISRLSHVECFPFLTGGQGAQQTSFNISNIANNGSGLYRVTLASPSSIPVTGDNVWISQTVVGPQSVQARRWVITVIDTTHLDLQGSAGTGSVAPTGTTASLSKTVTGLSSTANLGVGQTCTGTGIPGSTTITWLSPNGTDMGISNAATAGGTVTITCTDTAYSSGGTANLDAAYRSDIGMEFTNSEGDIGQDLFVFGHQTGYHLGTGMSWFSCTGCWSDGAGGTQNDITVTQLLIDSTAKGNTWAGGRLNDQAVRVNSSSAFAALTLIGVSLDSNANNWVPLIEQDQGIANYTGNSATNGASFFLFENAITAATVVGNNFGSGQFAFETAVGAAKVNPIGNTLNTTTYAGNAVFQNQSLKLGNQSGTCTTTTGTPCNISMGGPYADALFSQQNVSTGNTVALSGNGHTTYFHGTGTLTTLTITLPGIVQTGFELLFFFDQIVSTLTMNGVTQTGMPTAITANTWYKCVAISTSAFVCGQGWQRMAVVCMNHQRRPIVKEVDGDHGLPR